MYVHSVLCPLQLRGGGGKGGVVLVFKIWGLDGSSWWFLILKKWDHEKIAGK